MRKRIWSPASTVISDILFINCQLLLLELRGHWLGSAGHHRLKLLIVFYSMKGFSLVGSDAIRNNQLNSSSAKQSFQFSREERFRAPAAKYIPRLSQLPRCILLIPRLSQQAKDQLRIRREKRLHPHFRGESRCQQLQHGHRLQEGWQARANLWSESRRTDRGYCRNPPRTALSLGMS